MSNAKQEILGRIRGALKNSAAGPVIPRDYVQAGSLTMAERAALFHDRLRDYGCAVHETSAAQIALLLSRILRERGKQKLLIPAGLPRAWLPPEFEYVVDNNLPNAELEAADGVITGCALSIADTGTIVLRHSPNEGRRALTLLPDYHLCIVFENQIVETVPEGICAMQNFASTPITTISGPSATSDIEMTRIQGVHGPRVLDVLIVSS